MDITSLSPKQKWRTLLQQYQSSKKQRRRLRLLRQGVKKAKLFLVQKTVKALRSTQARLQQLSQANDDQSRCKRMKSVNKHEKNLTIVKGVDIDQVAVAAMLRMFNQNYGPVLSENQTDSDQVSIMKLICESAAVTAAITEIRGKNILDEAGSEDDSESEEIDEVDRLPAKNRPGQRARRALALEKFGNKAKFMNLKPKEVKGNEHPSWVASKQKKAMTTQNTFNGVKTKFV